ncbi:unnamed protein product [Arabidopsis thaliana]|uniref:Uncharacterized protein n=2 Tax=Arabidopsis thaliana TaxID=3702 RepID=A0A654FDH7_ARATH|nr:uncharacterized protein AT3G17655 [Arabidopsis thaliana]ANM63671.1 hypothetical protein AT3G17655 [Arabidopsis thaliana]CAA0382773.1 unnamed protein product [Arabidopsis thaliana]VYS57712.1 unnamed protein product [Arabidopsis thaliana]|eukprot:NP_001325745.1 hypothetical protein AT3G17655 [Arabidopsis thaliana]
MSCCSTTWRESRKQKLRPTFRRGTTEKRPRKLTTKRKPIIQPKEGSLTPRDTSPDWVAIRSLMPKSFFTAEGNARRGNNTGLNNSILLASKWLFQETRPMEHLSPCLDKEETQKTSRDIERRDDSRCEMLSIKLTTKALTVNCFFQEDLTRGGEMVEEVLLERESKLEGVNLDSFLHSDKSDSFMLTLLLKILCRYVC